MKKNILVLTVFFSLCNSFASEENIGKVTMGSDGGNNFCTERYIIYKNREKQNISKESYNSISKESYDSISEESSEWISSSQKLNLVKKKLQTSFIDNSLIENRLSRLQYILHEIYIDAHEEDNQYIKDLIDLVREDLDPNQKGVFDETLSLLDDYNN